MMQTYKWVPDLIAGRLNQMKENSNVTSESDKYPSNNKTWTNWLGSYTKDA